MSDIVFRAAGSKSQGVNVRWAIKAANYADKFMKDIPPFDKAARASASYSISEETLQHLNKKQTSSKSGWISTTTSLNRAIQILFVDHPDDGEIFIVSLQHRLESAEWTDIYPAKEVRDHLPPLKNGTRLENEKSLRQKSSDELLIWGKIEEHEILGQVSVQDLRQSCLNLIAPGLLKIKVWTVKESDVSEEIQSRWKTKFKISALRQITNVETAAAVQLAASFTVPSKLLIAKKFLSEDFRLDPMSRPPEGTIL
jgi:hypothetical protein